MPEPELIEPKVQNGMQAREWCWLLLTAVGLLIAYLSPLREYLSHVQDIRGYVESFGWLGPLLFFAFVTAATAIGVPRMAFYPMAGMAFGFYGGMLLSILSTISGCYLTFLYARWAGKALVKNKWPKMHQASGLLEGHGIVSVALIRQLPVPGHVTNLFLGISPIRHRAFIWGTVIGCLPAMAPAILIGSSLIQTDQSLRVAKTISAIVVLLLVWAGAAFFMRHTPQYLQLRMSLKSIVTDR